MPIGRNFFATTLAGLLFLGFQTNVVAQPLSDEALDQRIRDYILDHPEVVVEAIQRWQQQQRQAEAEQFKSVLQARRDEILDVSVGTVVGNPDGNVTVVEFMDYNCGYCRRVFPAIQQLAEDDGDLRILFKEFPILGPGSEIASRAALAAREQGLYSEFHNALMSADQRLEEPQVMAIAREVGLDTDQLRRDMQSPEIDAIIQRNQALARDLGINGTPGFIIGDEIVRGATSLDHLKQLVAEARRDAS
ncbi:MAG: DsbA family protein [Candidatus Competibacterales bacterium]|nr:DsbA family protein [Candidatus Competibacterales bacterium]